MLCLSGVPKTAARPKIEVPALVYAYLEAMADLGVYGDTAGRAAIFILRKEIMRLIEAGRIAPISKNLVDKLKGQDGDDDEAIAP